MPERIVVSFRGKTGSDILPKQPKPADASKLNVPMRPMTGSIPPGLGLELASLGYDYLARAVALKQRAEALGATLCSWSGHSFSFQLNPDELEEAISLAMLAIEDPGVDPVDRFSVGVAQGLLITVSEYGRLATLAWGHPLLIASDLARLADPGEILLDPAFAQLASNDLLFAGTRRSIQGAKRISGRRLDIEQPFRRQAAESVHRLRVPPLIGRHAELEQLAVPSGCMGVIRAEPGSGGTRLLMELMHHLSPSRALFVAPVGASNEPLGAIRRALSRSLALGGKGAEPVVPADPPSWAGVPVLPERMRGALTRLLAGEGTDPWTAAELLDLWLAPTEGRFGLLVVDDACAIDTPSLEVIANAINFRAAIRAMIRCGLEQPLPSALAPLVVAAEITLGPLSNAEMEELTCYFLDGRVDETVAQLLAHRAQGSPLAVREVLALALESGAVLWHENSVELRRKRFGKFTNLDERAALVPAKSFAEKRLHHLGEGPKAALISLAMLGGDASDTMIDAVAVPRAGSAASIHAVESILVGGGFAVRPEPGWLTLTSRTLRDILLDGIADHERSAWHLATAETIRLHGGLLGLADAAWHAAQAGQHRTASEFAAAAAGFAAQAMLDSAETTLRSLADEQILLDNPADAPASTAPPTYRMPLGAFDDGPLSGEAYRGRLDTLLEDQIAEEVSDAAEAISVKVAEVAPEVASAEPVSVAPRSSPREQDPLAKTRESPMVATSDLADQLVGMAKDALLQGDLPTLGRLLSELQAIGKAPDLVERLSALISLVQGAKDEALRRLRAATAVGQQPAQRAQALLAYGVALASSGRSEGALLEALSALAQARVANDSRGEQACASFLSRLSAAVGHDTAAKAWSDVAQRASRPS